MLEALAATSEISSPQITPSSPSSGCCASLSTTYTVSTARVSATYSALIKNL